MLGRAPPPYTSGAPMALKITVIGTGYLGATHAAAMAELGFEVLGPGRGAREDRDAPAGARSRCTSRGWRNCSASTSPGSRGPAGGCASPPTFAEVAAFGDVHFLCVNTPQKHGEYACDMSYVESALASLAPHLTGPALVVGKSTVPVGSADRLARYLAEHAPAGDDAELAWNPEFLREGFAVKGHAAPRPDRGRRAQRAGGEAAARGVRDAGSRRARPSSSPTSRRPNW